MTVPAQHALTTLMWLEEQHPQYVSRNSGRPALDRLKGALTRMSYWKAHFDLRMPGFTGRYEDHIDAVVAAWDMGAHKQLVEFLADGGYQAAFDRLSLDPTATLPAPKRPKGLKAAPKVTPAERTPEQIAADDEAELQAALEDELLGADPRLGAW